MPSTYLTDLKGAKCRILGLGRSNEALITYLYREGAEIIVSDKGKSENEIIGILEKNGIKKANIISYYTPNKSDFIFRTPSIRPDVPEVTENIALGAYLTSETELFLTMAKGKLIGVTGSDGKTTTTSLIYDILKSGGKDAYIGGNIGIPLISLVDKINENSITVCELSSFQLMTFNRGADLACITNITPNHLDWHIDMAEYVRSKQNIYDENSQKLVCGEVALPYLNRAENAYVISENNKSAASYKDKENIYLNGEKLIKLTDIYRKEPYNHLNFMSAAVICSDIVDHKAMLNTARSFKGVPHRNEFVRYFNGVGYYNCSIDSTPSRTIQTVLSHSESGIILICGGYDKKLDYSEFAYLLKDRVKHFFLIGENKTKIKNALEKVGTDRKRVIVCNTLSEGVFAASAAAKNGDAVLLSPASASFDMFKDFEARGNVFKNIVNNL